MKNQKPDNLDLMHEYTNKLSYEDMRSFLNYFVGALSVHTNQNEWQRCLNTAASSFPVFTTSKEVR